MSSMPKLMKQCPICQIYTFQDQCSKCRGVTRSPHPPKFSMERDRKYAKYRRFYKSEKKLFEGNEI
ncbi:MAG: nucleolar RNA-binding Nop10p family protein [Promethearchaeota archaeon]